jgi:hypothetical protein
MIHAIDPNADPEFDLRTQICGLDRLRILAVEFPAEFRERRPGRKPGWDGAPGGIRTPDPLLRRQMLYPAELRAQNP